MAMEQLAHAQHLNVRPLVALARAIAIAVLGLHAKALLVYKAAEILYAHPILI